MLKVGFGSPVEPGANGAFSSPRFSVDYRLSDVVVFG